MHVPLQDLREPRHLERPGVERDPTLAVDLIREAAHLPKLRMYDLRHHAITALLENPDISEETVEDIAGHVSRRMKKRYSHIRMEYKRAAVEAIMAKRKPVKSEKSTQLTAQPPEVAELAAMLFKMLKAR